MEYNNKYRSDGFVFEWKGFIFSTFLDGSNLKLCWAKALDLNLQEAVNSQECRNGIDLDKSPTDSPFDDVDSEIFANEKKSFIPTKSNLTTSLLALGEHTDLEIVTVGYSFDPGCLGKVPIILLQGSKVSKQGSRCDSKRRLKTDLRNYDLILVSVSHFNAHANDAMNDEQVPFSQRKDQSDFAESGTKNFTLVCVRNYPVNLNSHQNLANRIGFAPDFQMILQNTESASLTIFSLDKETHEILNQVVSLNIEGTLTETYLLDTFVIENDGIFFTLISVVTEGGKQILFLKFSLTESLSLGPSTINKKSEMFDKTVLSVSILFHPDFTQIIKAVKIASISCYHNKVSNADVISTALTVVTRTGFALHFVDGTMKSCVNITDHLGLSSFSEDDWEKASVDIVNCVGCDYEKTAIQVANICCLINWRNNEIEEVWYSVVLTCHSSAVKKYGVPVLVLVQHLENNFKGCLQQLDGAKCIVHNLDGERHHSNSRGCNNRGRSGSQTDDEMDNADLMEQPQCAVTALLSQKQRCESAVRQAELTLANKMSFFTDTWQQLAWRHLDYNDSFSHHNTSQILLVPLIEGSVSTPSCDQHAKSHDQTPTKFVETYGLWKRTVDSLLIVGLTVKNVCKSPITNIYLSLVPSSLGAENTCHSTAKYGLDLSCSSTPSTEPHISLSRKMNIVVDEKKTSNKTCLLQPGSETVVFSYTDVSQAISGKDLKYHVFVSFTVIESDLVNRRQDNEFSGNTKSVDEYCTEVELSVQDLLSEVFSVGSSLGDGKEFTDKTIDHTTLLALDCVQTSSSLVIQSVITSVNCLTAKLMMHSSIRHIEWAKQYIVVANHQLKFCRLCVSEPETKCLGKLKIFGRSEQQKLLFVKFLYSLLPEDVTIVPALSSPSSVLEQAGATVFEEINSSLNAVRQQLETLTTTEVSSVSFTEEEPEVEAPGSPKFSSSKLRKSRIKLAGKQKPQAGHETSEAGESSGSNLKRESSSDGNVRREKLEVRDKRKRLREKWGDEEDES